MQKREQTIQRRTITKQTNSFLSYATSHWPQPINVVLVVPLTPDVVQSHALVEGGDVEGTDVDAGSGWDGGLATNGFGPGTLVGPTDWAWATNVEEEITAMPVIKASMYTDMVMEVPTMIAV